MAKCLFCTIRLRCPQRASGALDAPFARFAPSALNNFRHPCLCAGRLKTQDILFLHEMQLHVLVPALLAFCFRHCPIMWYTSSESVISED